MIFGGTDDFVAGFAIATGIGEWLERHESDGEESR
jgi:hypothetical protein